MRTTMNSLAGSVALSFILISTSSAGAGDGALGDAIFLDPATIEALTVDRPPVRQPRGVQNTNGFSIDRSNRTSVVAAFHRYYLDSETYTTNHGWDGNIGSCYAGTVSAAFLDDTRRRINYFRAQAGLPSDIYFSSTKNSKSQQAALMMSRNNTLDHTPPTWWPCYTAGGAEAADAGNLSLGFDRYGPGAVNGQMIDDGGSNGAAGHRRWLLFSRAREMGAGSIPANTQGYKPAACIWVIGNFKPAPSAQAIPWPNEGYVPWQIVPNQSQTYPRWSFSYPGANFAGATVTMSRGGSSIAVTKESVVEGAGDNSIVWRPSGIPNAAPASDTTYSVTISGVTGVAQSTFSYNVTLVDPFTLGTDITVSGPAAPTVGQSTSYSFNPIGGVDGYEVSISGVAAGNWLEGAEAAGSIIDGTSGSYNYRTTTLAATGSYSFHLTIPDRTEVSQAITVGREIVPTASSRLQFKNRFRFMTAATELHAEVSSDAGASWNSVWSRSPSSDILNSSNWEPGWNQSSIPIPPEYHGRSIRVRLRLGPETPTSSLVLGTETSHGAFVDDIVVSNSQELVNSAQTPLSSSSSGFNFNPPSAVTYAMRVRAQAGTHWFGFGPVLFVTAQSGQPTPSIASLSPSSGQVGSAVVINGANFSATPAQNLVRFGGVQAAVTSATSTRLETTVPAGVSGTVAVTVTVGGRGSNAVNFQVTQPPMDPDIGVTPGSLPFGDVQVGRTGQLSLTIRNTGQASLAVTGMSSSNGRFTFAPGAPLSIGAGSQQTVTVTFSPNALGAQSGTLTILSNDPDEASVAVAVSGNGVSQPGGNTIYATDFSNFPDGPNSIDGTDGWSATPTGDGSSGTFTPTGFPQLGQSAFVGFNAPSDDFVGIWRPLNRDPLAEGNPVVEFGADLAIIDSTNGVYDIFSLRLYNSTIDLLATITFDNRNLNIHTWDGVGFRDTGKDFENGPLFRLSGSIDFATNTWSAEMVSSSPGSVHVPLFEDLPFHSGSHDRDLGLLLFAWQLDDQTGASAGDNFMLVDNVSVSFAASGGAPRITRTWMGAGGAFNMTWEAVEGYSYQVRHSADMRTWRTGLPNSNFATAPGQTQHTFTDHSGVGERFYQVTSTPPPG